MAKQASHSFQCHIAFKSACMPYDQTDVDMLNGLDPYVGINLPTKLNCCQSWIAGCSPALTVAIFMLVWFSSLTTWWANWLMNDFTRLCGVSRVDNHPIFLGLPGFDSLCPMSWAHLAQDSKLPLVCVCFLGTA